MHAGSPAAVLVAGQQNSRPDVQAFAGEIFPEAAAAKPAAERGRRAIRSPSGKRQPIVISGEPGSVGNPGELIVERQIRKATPGPASCAGRRVPSAVASHSHALNRAHQLSNHNIWGRIQPDPISSGFAFRFPFSPV